MQGGPEGSALYSIAQASVLKALRAKFPDIFALSLHDDSYLIGKPERAFEAFKWLRKEFFESLHLELAKEKCTAFVPPSSFPEGALAPQFVEKRNTTAALASAHGISLSTTGIIATGVPIGSDSFIDNHLEEIAEQALETANKAQQLHGAALDKRYTLSLNRIFTLIRLCIPSQLTHLLRTVPPSRTRAWAREFDDSLSRCIATLFGWPTTSDPDHVKRHFAVRAKRVLFLNSSSGGLGLGSSARAVGNAYIASIALIGRTISRLTGLDPEALVHHIQEANEAFQEAKALETQCLKDVNSLQELLAGEPVERAQTALNRTAIAKEFMDVSQLFHDPQSRAVFAGGASGGQFVSTYHSSMRDEHFKHAVSMRAGFPVSYQTGICRGCKKLVSTPEQLFHHPYTCSYLQGVRSERHHDVNSALYHAFNKARAFGKILWEPKLVDHGYQAKPDSAPHILNNTATARRIPVRADLIINDDGTPIVVDVVLTHPEPEENVGEGCTRAANEKYRRYRKHYSITRAEILPAAFETTGYLLPAADEAIKRLLRKAHGAQDPNGPVTLEYVKAYSHLRMRLSTVIHQKIGEMCSVYLKHCEPNPNAQIAQPAPLAAEVAPVLAPGHAQAPPPPEADEVGQPLPEEAAPDAVGPQVQAAAAAALAVADA